MEFPPILSPYPSDYRINVDGLLTLSNREREQRAYVQVFHTGIVEAVASSFLQGDRTPQSPARLTALKTEHCIVKYSHDYLKALLALGFPPLFAVLVSLIGVKEVPYSFTMGNSLFEDEAGMLDRDQLHFQEVIIEDVQPNPYDTPSSCARFWIKRLMLPEGRLHHLSMRLVGFA